MRYAINGPFGHHLGLELLFHPVEESENDEDNDDDSGDDEDGTIEFEYKDEFADKGDDNKNSDNGVQDDSE
eukprot:scaffold87172_cov49-Attheya_sp.AAC.1